MWNRPSSFENSFLCYSCSIQTCVFMKEKKNWQTQGALRPTSNLLSFCHKWRFSASFHFKNANWITARRSHHARNIMFLPRIYVFLVGCVKNILHCILRLPMSYTKISPHKIMYFRNGLLYMKHHNWLDKTEIIYNLTYSHIHNRFVDVFLINSIFDINFCIKEYTKS